jgi:hypothetical protein
VAGKKMCLRETHHQLQKLQNPGSCQSSKLNSALAWCLEWGLSDVNCFMQTDFLNDNGGRKMQNQVFRIYDLNTSAVLGYV